LHTPSRGGPPSCRRWTGWSSTGGGWRRSSPSTTRWRCTPPSSAAGVTSRCPSREELRMGQLVYVGIGSLDGYVADEDGDFAWSAPDEEVHAYLNERERRVTAELYGRRLYEVMKVWETYGAAPDSPDVERDYGEQWRGRPKVAFSRTLPSVDTARPRLERRLPPAPVRPRVHEDERG